KAIDLFANNQFSIKTDVLFSFEVPRLDEQAAGQRMPWRAGQYHLFVAPRMGHQLAQLARERHQAEVYRPVQYALVDAIGMEIFHMDPGLGVHSLKTLNVLPHVPQPDRVDGGNPDVSNADAFFAANRFLQLPIFGQDPPAALIESFPCLREL